MSRHTSWRVGGPAELFYKPASLDDLSLFLSTLDEDVPVFWFGLGSNLLVRDGGLPGVVIAASGIFTELEKTGEQTVRVGGSVPCTQLARQCIRWGLGPSEFFAGIPGLVGGALAMNAGAHGGETWERVTSVTTIDRHGSVHVRDKDEYSISYRHVDGPQNEWFTGADLHFDPEVSPSMGHAQRNAGTSQGYTTTGPVELWLGVSQSTRRPRSEIDRSCGPQRVSYWWCRGIRQARQLHYQ